MESEGLGWRGCWVSQIDLRVLIFINSFLELVEERIVQT